MVVAEQEKLVAGKLAQLKRLLYLRDKYAEELNEQGLRLVDRCVVATLGCLHELGAHAEAHAVLRRGG